MDLEHYKAASEATDADERALIPGFKRIRPEAPKQLTCERCGNKTDAGAWIGFVYVGAECLDQDDKGTIAELESEGQ